MAGNVSRKWLAGFAKPGKVIVVELDDEVEYILDENAFSALLNGTDIVTATRVVDRTPHSISARRILWAMQSGNVVDYLDAEKA